MSVRELCCALLASALLFGQDSPGNSGRVTISAHSEDQSRALFAGCDRNGDDRLDLFEAMATIDNVANREAFRRMDRDRDGYVDWPEFDQFFQFVIRGGGSLRLRVQNVPQKTTSSQSDQAPRIPAQQAIAAFDQNHNGALDADEYESLLRELRLPADVVAQLRSLDRDRDNKISESELTPVLSKLQLSAIFTPRRKGATDSPLPSPWRDVDENGSGKVELAELQAALRRMDPALEPWAEQILKGADTNGDGALSAPELAPVPLPAGRSPGKAVVPPASPR
jgi:Ca2+-binding EF-hand superfamily protein